MNILNVSSNVAFFARCLKKKSRDLLSGKYHRSVPGGCFWANHGADYQKYSQQGARGLKNVHRSYVPRPRWEHFPSGEGIEPWPNISKQASSSRQAAASKQEPAFAPLKEWTNISFKSQRDTKNWIFSRRTALKQWNRSITKSCDDAKLELFPGARPPDTTFRNWYDLNRALVWSSKNPTEIHGFDPQKPLKRFNKSLQIS